MKYFGCSYALCLDGSDCTKISFKKTDGSVGEVYFYGYSSSKDDEVALAPLDEYGVAYGCTEIQYKNPVSGCYETL